eukprot:763609-Hanusia_phi.AAC.1
MSGFTDRAGVLAHKNMASSGETSSSPINTPTFLNNTPSSLRAFPAFHNEASSAFNNYCASHSASTPGNENPSRCKTSALKHGSKPSARQKKIISLDVHSAKPVLSSAPPIPLSIDFDDDLLSSLQDDALCPISSSTAIPSASSITSLTLHGDELKCLPSLIVSSYPDAHVPIHADPSDPPTTRLPPISAYFPIFSHEITVPPPSSILCSKPDCNNAIIHGVPVVNRNPDPAHIDLCDLGSKERRKRTWDGAARARHSQVCTGRTRLTLTEKAEIIKLYYNSPQSSSINLDQKTLARMYNKSPAAISKILKPEYAFWVLSKCVRILSSEEISHLSFLIKQIIRAEKGG